MLDGVPGAGKTEVYFEAIAAALAAGRQVLVLLPEIALTSQWLKRFEDRFGCTPAPWHSGLTSLERRETWRAIADGRVGVVVGARSALFLPFERLGLIVVDEEHDGSFKQDDGVAYNARDMAVVRARLVGAPIVLASATPSLESVTNVTAGRYGALHLPRRHGGQTLARLQAVDLKTRGAAARPLAVAARGRGDEADLCRGRADAAVPQSPRLCADHAVPRLRPRHRMPAMLGLAGRASLPPDLGLPSLRLLRAAGAWPASTAARKVSSWPAVRASSGWRRRRMELFPEARIELFTSDTLMSRSEAAAAVERMIEGKIDILIGTQMAAKGHHFPSLTLVAVVDADLGLNGGDLRAAERTFQMLYQVAGRAGREDRPGRALIQTYQPEHAVMQALVVRRSRPLRRRPNWPIANWPACRPTGGSPR